MQKIITGLGRTLDDQTYLEYLVRNNSDNQWADLMAENIQSLTEVDTPATHACLFIDYFRENALEALSSSEQETLKHISIVLLPSKYINACALRTLQGNPAIMLNYGLISNMQYLIQSLLALMTYRTNNAICRDHSEYDFLETIALLAAYFSTGKSEYFNAAPAIHCPSLTDDNANLLSATVQTIKFILLHEYGHITLGHLNDKRVRTLQISPSIPISIYSKSQQQEFEADYFAIERLMGIKDKTRMESSFTFAVLLIRFFDLVERFKTSGDVTNADSSHPPAQARCQRILEQIQTVVAPDAIVFRTRFLFSQIGDIVDNIIATSTE